ncbi:unnamed protein product [Prunus armeniaca]
MAKFLALIALELDVHEVCFTNSHGQQYHPSDVVLDGNEEFLVLVFDQALGVGEGVLGIGFSAVLNAHLKGFYKLYFSTPYPLPKLDNSNLVAVPEFSGGAMENYGLIPYHENEMLYDHLHSTTARKQRVYFQLLSTLKSPVMYVLFYTLFPERKIWPQFLHQTTGGLVKDALERSHPIEVEMHPARSILEVFGDISYKKGSAVIRMLQSYLEDDIFPVCYDVVKISSEAIPDSANDLKQFFHQSPSVSSRKTRLGFNTWRGSFQCTSESRNLAGLGYLWP